MDGGAKEAWCNWLKDDEGVVIENNDIVEKIKMVPKDISVGDSGALCICPDGELIYGSFNGVWSCPNGKLLESYQHSGPWSMVYSACGARYNNPLLPEENLWDYTEDIAREWVSPGIITNFNGTGRC